MTRAHSPSLRWLVPLLALALALGIPAVWQRAASADPGLPPRTAEELIADLARAKPVPMSGTISQQTNLGLPTLPGDMGDSPLALLAQDATWKVWTDGREASRVARLQRGSETTLVHRSGETWLWDSRTREAVHHRDTGDERRGQATHRKQAERPDAPTPDQLARQVLAAIDPTTAVSTETSTTVAGRAAYQLVLVPEQQGSTVARVSLAIDAETKLPLRLVVLARGSDKPAITVGFTAISFGRPAASTFVFTPPADAKVTESRQRPGLGRPQPGGRTPSGAARVVGTGWTRVHVIDGVDTTFQDDPSVQQVLEQFPQVSGDWGKGRLVTTTLVNAVITADGRIAIGAVEPGLLFAALR